MIEIRKILIINKLKKIKKLKNIDKFKKLSKKNIDFIFNDVDLLIYFLTSFNKEYIGFQNSFVIVYLPLLYNLSLIHNFKVTPSFLINQQKLSNVLSVNELININGTFKSGETDKLRNLLLNLPGMTDDFLAAPQATYENFGFATMHLQCFLEEIILHYGYKNESGSFKDKILSNKITNF
jgi:hypothetical protein